MDQANGDVRQDFGWAGFHISPIGLIGLILCFPKLADVERFLGIFLPQREIPNPEKVLIIQEQFLQTRPGDVGELEFHLRGGDGGLAAFGDVLFSGTGGLHHLVDSAVSAFEELLAEAEGEVIDDLGLFVGEEVLVVSAWWKEVGGVIWHGGVLRNRSYRAYRTYIFW